MEQKQVKGLLDECDGQLLQLQPVKSKFKLELLKTIDHQPPNQLQSHSTNSIYQLLYLIYDSRLVLSEKPIPTVVSEEAELPVQTHLPLFYKCNYFIKIPTKVKKTLNQYTPRHLLHDIHQDEDVAIELCLMFLSKLASTHFISRDNPDDPGLAAGWKALHSDILIKEFSIKINTYKKIVKALQHKTSQGAILECDELSIIGSKSYYYRFGDAYRNKGIVSYQIQTKVARELLNKNCNRMLAEVSDNPIVKNLFMVYPQIQLPTLEEIMEEARCLVRDHFITKKRKKLTFLGNHGRDYYRCPKERSFVEDAIEIFEYLTDHGLMIPSVGDEKSGGRVVDSFTLMPSWIRNMCKIDGKRLVEVDYSALHPNISCTIYGGKKQYITHQMIAQEAGIDKDLVKHEHLSFFNKKWEDMVHSPLYGYYIEREPTMMANIYYDKAKGEYGHKSTSRRLFKMEVEIMTEVITRLNGMGVYVGYVYDALLCTDEEQDLVQSIMDKVALMKGVYTNAK